MESLSAISEETTASLQESSAITEEQSTYVEVINSRTLNLSEISDDLANSVQVLSV